MSKVRSKRVIINKNSDQSSFKRHSTNSTQLPKSSLAEQISNEAIPGSIVSIYLANFVTYTKAQFLPGENLNIIIGPNGSGKSSLVCAIALGLGYSPLVLGRAKEAQEYIKYGSSNATIRITLKDQSNQTIERIIYRNKPSLWKINGMVTHKKHVQNLVSKYGIQVDNLCHFLPQDRVGQFATLSPQKMLLETERAIGGNDLMKKHLVLIDYEKDLDQVNKQAENLETELEHSKQFQKQLESQVQLFNQRMENKKRIELLEHKLLVIDYKDAEKAYDQKKKECLKAESDLLEFKASHNTIIIKEKEIESKLSALKQRRYNDLQLAESKRDLTLASKQKIESLRLEKNNIIATVEDLEKRIKDKSANIESQKKQIELSTRSLGVEPEIPDFTTLNSKLSNVEQSLYILNMQINMQNEDFAELQRLLSHKYNKLSELKSKIDELSSIQGSRKELLRKYNREDCVLAYEWLNKNRHLFKQEVYGPAFLYINVTNNSLIPAIEACLRAEHYTAFTFLNRQDYELFVHKIIDTNQAVGRKLRVFATEWSESSMPSIKYQNPPLEPNKIKSLGFLGYAIDFLHGPEPVLNTLCNLSSLHQIPISSKEVSDESLKEIERQISAGKRSIKRFVSGTFLGTFFRSNYGKNLVSSTWMPIKLDSKYFKENNVQTTSIRDEYKQLDDELQKLKHRQNTKQKETQLLQSELSQQELVKANLKAEKKKILSKVNDWQSQNQVLNLQKRELKQNMHYCETLTSQALLNKDRIESVICEIKNKTISLAVLTRQYVQDVCNSALSQISVIKSENIPKKLISILHILNSRRNELSTNLQQLDQELKDLSEDLQQKKNILDSSRFMQEVEEINQSADEIQEQIQIEQAHFDMLHVPLDVIQEYEKNRERIAQLEGSHREKQENIEQLQSKIQQLSLEWESAVEPLFLRIDKAFGDYFESFSCAGRVSFAKANKFCDYSVQIYVKFRANDKLSLLDSQRQSGGERSVSTIFYLLALHSLSQSPIRVLDEINQGMDPINERLVHKNLVLTSCNQNKSQYFLITPKLLSGLYYNQDTKVHCIYSADQIAGNPSYFGFSKITQKI